MKKLRNIFAALKTLRRIPWMAINTAWAQTRAIAASATMNDSGEKAVPPEYIDLIDSIVEAVVAIAKDDEDKAAAPGKADKPAA